MMSSILVTISLTIATVASGVGGYASGPPFEVCDSMLPKHGVDAQTGTSGYTVTVSPSNYACGNVLVTLGGTSEFKGFFCQPRTSVDTGSSRVGTVEIDGQGGIQKQCSNQAVCHTSSYSKSSIQFTWVPNGNHGNVYMVCTWVESGSLFWLKEAPVMLTYNQSANCNDVTTQGSAGTGSRNSIGFVLTGIFITVASRLTSFTS